MSPYRFWLVPMDSTGFLLVCISPSSSLGVQLGPNGSL